MNMNFNNRRSSTPSTFHNLSDNDRFGDIIVVERSTTNTNNDTSSNRNSNINSNSNSNNNTVMKNNRHLNDTTIATTTVIIVDVMVAERAK